MKAEWRLFPIINEMGDIDGLSAQEPQSALLHTILGQKETSWAGEVASYGWVPRGCGAEDPGGCAS